MERKAIYQIEDTFHPWAYADGEKNKLIKSTMFESDEDFFDWCRQHGADGKWEELEVI